MTTVTDKEKVRLYRKSHKQRSATKRINDHIKFVKKQVNGTIFVGGHDGGEDCAVLENEGLVL